MQLGMGMQPGEWYALGPVERYQRATADQARAEALVHRASDLRALACAELHGGGWSFARIAEAIGLSRARVQQLVTRGREVEAPAEPSIEVAPAGDEEEPLGLVKLKRHTDSQTAATLSMARLWSPLVARESRHLSV